MKRLCVFVFYNQDGILNKSTLFLLKSLRTVMQHIVVIVNGKIQRESREVLEQNVNLVFQRENMGFDAGAYKDVFTQFLKSDALENWDEIFLINDTFFGPFYPWESIFEKMEKKELDFWGLSSMDKGGAWGNEFEYASHIQAYFLCIGKNMFTHPSFVQYWKELKYPITYVDAIRYFETKFTEYFATKGFTWSSYLGEEGLSYEHTVNPYIEYSDDLVINNGFPLLKKRAIMFRKMDRCVRLINYLKEHQLYDTELIYEYMMEVEEDYELFSIKRLEKFCQAYQGIYIYGAGKFGTRIANYLSIRQILQKGFVVSDEHAKNKKDVIALSQLNLGPNEGMIIALNQKNLEQVKPILFEKIDERQMLLPMF